MGGSEPRIGKFCEANRVPRGSFPSPQLGESDTRMTTGTRNAYL